MRADTKVQLVAQPALVGDVASNVVVGAPVRSRSVPAFQLPAEPPGYEGVDFAWAQMARQAEEFLARLPAEADESWGDARGITSYLVAVSDACDANKALEAEVAPRLRQVRQREVRRRNWWLYQCTQLTAAVYARRARKMYPAAQPWQVLMLVRDQLQRGVDDLLATAGAPGTDASTTASSAPNSSTFASSD